MHDISPHGPNHQKLFEIASQQMGYFTARQAKECGFRRDMLSYHTKTGRFERKRHGVYRLRDYPSTPREEVMMAWLAAGKDTAIVSHESALDLLELSDVIPSVVHLTVPRSRRYLGSHSGVRYHTTTRMPEKPHETTVRDGIRLTGVARSIVDSAEYGTAPEQIELAVEQAIRSGLTTTDRILDELAGRNKRVQNLISQALVGVHP